MMIWKSFAPSNIALIKYMGKEGENQAVNGSLSMTLSNFRTDVELEIKEGEDRWAPLPGSAPLREESTVRFVTFFQKLKQQSGIKESFWIRSGNNFPSDAGLASSASSFAALTKVAMETFAHLQKRKAPTALEMARVSRTGSGSSCRSFFAPWCRWEGDDIREVPSSLPNLIDLVAVVDGGFKKVSSSNAHQKVRTSALFPGRVARANSRLAKLESAMIEGNLQRVSEISWEELWDMHGLFHTSEPPFFYFAPQTITALRWAEDCWEKKGKGPITTIDAGPNVHFLVPEEEKAFYLSDLSKLNGIKILESKA
jgi:diphosphomevalonate decarboxylase